MVLYIVYQGQRERAVSISLWPTLSFLLLPCAGRFTRLALSLEHVPDHREQAVASHVVVVHQVDEEVGALDVLYEMARLGARGVDAGPVRLPQGESFVLREGRKGGRKGREGGREGGEKGGREKGGREAKRRESDKEVSSAYQLAITSMCAHLPYEKAVWIDNGRLDDLLAREHSPSHCNWLHGITIGRVLCTLQGGRWTNMAATVKNYDLLKNENK